MLKYAYFSHNINKDIIVRPHLNGISIGSVVSVQITYLCWVQIVQWHSPGGANVHLI